METPKTELAEPRTTLRPTLERSGTIDRFAFRRSAEMCGSPSAVLGAKTGDVFMSIIQTSRRNGFSPARYLLTLMRNTEAVAANPSEWLPWNYP